MAQYYQPTQQTGRSATNSSMRRLKTFMKNTFLRRGKSSKTAQPVAVQYETSASAYPDGYIIGQPYSSAAQAQLPLPATANGNHSRWQRVSGQRMSGSTPPYSGNSTSSSHQASHSHQTRRTAHQRNIRSSAVRRQKRSLVMK